MVARGAGLGEELVRDLDQWGRDMEEVDGTPELRTTAAYAALDARARELVARVRAVLA